MGSLERGSRCLGGVSLGYRGNFCGGLDIAQSLRLRESLVRFAVSLLLLINKKNNHQVLGGGLAWCVPLLKFHLYKNPLDSTNMVVLSHEVHFVRLSQPC